MLELAKADSVRTLKDAPAPGTTNKVTSALKTMVTTNGGKYESNNDQSKATENKAPKDKGWTVVTKGFQPRIAQHTPTTTHNAFAILLKTMDPR